MSGAANQQLKCAIIRVMVNHNAFHVSMNVTQIHNYVPMNTTKSAVQNALTQLANNYSFVIDLSPDYLLDKAKKQSLWRYVNNNCGNPTTNILRPIIDIN